MEQEAEQSIDRAFDEGYKQGLLASAPETEFWKTKSQKLETQLAVYKKQRLLWTFGGVGTGLILGFGVTFTTNFFK